MHRLPCRLWLGEVALLTETIEAIEGPAHDARQLGQDATEKCRVLLAVEGPREDEGDEAFRERTRGVVKRGSSATRPLEV